MKSKIIFYNKDYTELDKIIYENDNAPTNWRRIYQLSLPHSLSAKIIIEEPGVNEAPHELTKILADQQIDPKHVIRRTTSLLIRP